MVTENNHCANYNHRRANAPVRFCPVCREIVNHTIPDKLCHEKKHARAHNEDRYCPDCGKQLFNGNTTMTHVNRTTTALLLAAGTGSRLRPLTTNSPKCLTMVGGYSILERLIHILRLQGIKRLIVVIGHQGDRIRDFLQDKAIDIQVDYITNPLYKTTNNIYSLWLARQKISEPFLLVESDLIFEFAMLNDMLQPDKIAISNRLPWMNGTTVELNAAKKVTTFNLKPRPHNNHQYKTVNIYSFSLPTWHKIEEQLSHHIHAKNLNDYYEVVFADMIANGSLSLNAVFFNEERWYEIDSMIDLSAAEKLVNISRSRKDRFSIDDALSPTYA